MLLQVFRRYGRQFAAVTALAALLPTIASASAVRSSYNGGFQPDFKYGLVLFHPKQITLSINSLFGATAHFRVHQRGNKANKFRSSISCDLTLGNKPRVDQDGARGTITVGPSGLLGISVGCTVTTLGEGGVTGQMPVLIQVGL